MTSRAGKSSGFTLLELLIGLALLGLLMGLVTTQVGKLLEREMKNSANRLAATIRYLYDKSISDGMTLRLVFDFEAQKYWAESTAGPFAVRREEEEAFAKKTPPKKKEEAAEKEEEDEEEEAATEVQPKEAVFGMESSYLLKPVILPKGVYFKDVYAEHQIERLDEGQAFIYFFPQGYVERSVINLRNADDEVHYSLEVSPITGEVKIERAYKEAEIEH